MTETDNSKRWSRDKGYVSFHPEERFLIHVQWIVSNMQVAHEMMEGLRTCAKATHRDTPPVICYFFRISHDQTLAQELKKNVKTVSQHPHYAKAYKMMDMNMTREFVISKCQREGISPVPFEENWPRNEPMDAHAAELQFDPVVIDLTELYLDSRSFVDHACSRDYMEGYSILMAPHRSLQPYTSVLGTPTDAVWNSVLEPILKARRVDVSSSGEIMGELLAIDIPVRHQVLTTPSQTSTEQSYVFFDLDVAVRQVDTVNFLVKLQSNFQPVYIASVLNQQGTYYRVMLACKSLLFESCVMQDIGGGMEKGILSGDSVCKLDIKGSLFLSHHMLYSVDVLQKHVSRSIKIYHLPPIYTGASEDGFSRHEDICFVGYGLHDRYAELVPDSSVTCKEIPSR